jgi:inner membrane protein
MAWTLAFAILPDVDAILGLLSGDFGRYHNNGTHSLLLGLGVAFLGAGLIWLKERQGFLIWFLAAWLSYASHVILDIFTIGGRGVMLLWPLSDQRYESSIKLFFGVRWSEGFFSIEHLWTLGSELILLLVVLLVLAVFRGGTRPGVERSEGKS